MQKEEIFHENVLPSEFTNVRFCTFINNARYTPNHWHDSIEIIYMLEGRILQYMEGKTWDVTVGKCIIVNSNVIHSCKSIEHGKYILLQIPLDFIRKFIPEIQHINFVLNSDEKNHEKLQQIDKLKQILLKMKEINDTQEKGFLLKFNSYLFDLLYLLYTNFSAKISNTDSQLEQKDFARLDKILKYIKQNYQRAISLEEIANVVIFTPNYFCRFFKKYMGTTFLEYQNEVRLSFIYRDIIETQEPIYKILEKHGFTNYKMFRRMFHERFGDTPMKIRQHAMKNTAT